MANYYDEHYINFINETIDSNMSSIYSFFESHLNKIHHIDDIKILDVGFGSARDMLYFKNKGYKVSGIDTSLKMCLHAYEMNLNDVEKLSVLDLDEKEEYDAIWACASLLHLKSSELNEAFKRCSRALKEDGIMYASFKYGDFEGTRNERYYLDLNEISLIKYLKDTNLEVIYHIITDDVRPNHNEKWLNVILKKVS